MLNAKTFSEAIVLASHRSGVKGRELARRVGCSHQCLSGYIQGKVVPKDFRLIGAFSEALGIEPGILETLAAADLALRRTGLNGRRKPVAA